MPIYEYKCRKCRRVIETMHPVNAIPGRVKCPCGKMARRQLSRCASLPDGDVKWLKSAVEVMQPDWERPVRTRAEWKRYQKEHGIVCAG